MTRNPLLLLVTIIGSLAAALALPAAPARAAVVSPPRPTIIVYGDSLAWESQDFISFFLHLGKVDVVMRTFPGTALCDWSASMAHDARTHPMAVILAFTGVSLTPCMRDANGVDLTDQERIDKYRADSEAALSIFADTKVWFAGYPISRSADVAPDGQALREMYKSLGTSHPNAHWVDAGVLDVTPDGHYTDTLPCLPFEPCQPTRISVVRAPDGAHFCPIPHNDGRYECSMWSSGAFRYGLMMALPVLHDLGLLR